MSTDSNQASQPLYFNCQMCGECCSSWNIPVETEKALRLLEKPWVQERLAETNRKLTRMTEDTYRIPLTDENVCVFLAEDRRCMVEAREGLSLKPHECQRFPFATVRLPNGTDWHETSAACKSISEKLLLAFQPILPRPGNQKAGMIEAKTDAPEGIAQDFNNIDASLELTAKLPGRIPVGGLRWLDLVRYQVYQNQLMAIFMQPDLHPESALVQVRQWLQHVATSPESACTTPLEKSSSNARFLPALAAWMTLCFLRKPYRTLNWVSLLLGASYADPRIFGMPIQLRQQRRIPWNPKLNLHLNAFLFNLLQRKRLVALGSSLSSHLAMAGIACLLVQWYAKTLVWMQSGTEISEKDLATAIRLVERYYTGHQPRFLAFFTSRWRGELISMLLFGWLLPRRSSGSPYNSAVNEPSLLNSEMPDLQEI